MCKSTKKKLNRIKGALNSIKSFSSTGREEHVNETSREIDWPKVDSWRCQLIKAVTAFTLCIQLIV